jgi:signal transduction histidine kinase/ligand-binding sensor domain-containing protein
VKFASTLYRIVIAFLLAVHVPTSAQHLAPLLSDYLHTSWGAVQGAPVGVLQIAQTTDGWLWITSEKGLYRFDGVQFERVESVYGHKLLSSDLMGLMAGKDGSLWVGYRLGGVSVFSRSGSKTFTENDGLPGGNPYDIQTAPDGSIWVGTREGAYRLDRRAGRFEHQGDKVGLPRAVVFQTMVSRDGMQWIASAGGVFFRKPGEERFTAAWKDIQVRYLKEDADGTIWGLKVGDDCFRVRPAAPGAKTTLDPKVSALIMGFDRDGYAWLLTPNAVERRRTVGAPAGDAQRVTLERGLSGAYPQSFLQDREGNVWIGTLSGIDRFRRNRLQSVPLSEELIFPGMVPGLDGHLWVSNHGGGIHSVSAAGRDELVSHDRMTASHRAPDGALWTASSAGLRRRVPDEGMTITALPEGQRDHDPQALQQDNTGALWVSISGGGGIYRLVQGKWIKNGGLAGLPTGVTFVMAMDEQGTVWMGHQRNLISLVMNDRGRLSLKRFDDRSGLSVGNVLALYRDGKTMWTGGELGTMLYRDGRFVALQGQGGETFRGVSGIERLKNGELWLHGVDGVFRIPASSLAEWIRDPGRLVDFERFDALDGLRGHATQLRPLPSLIQGTDEKLWLLTGSAIAFVDPRHIYRNRLPPPVTIRSVVANDQTHVIEGRKTLSLPEGTTSLRLGFTALSLAMPERVMFRYRLDGVDQSWQQGVGRRNISYTNLSPGNYRFEVLAANEDGVWGSEPTTLGIDIRPTFVQTKWFTLLLLLAAVLLLSSGYALRIRSIRRRLQERHQAQLEERSRIARSLHDTLLQSVQGLLLTFDAHARHAEEGSRERARLEKTLDLGWRLVEEGREQILNLRAAASPDELYRVLQPYGKDLAEHAGHTFDIRTTGKARPLKPHVHEEMYAIGREALFNASRYAEAHCIILELDYGNEAFTLRIRDDGCGLDSAVAASGHRPGHWGLLGMRERAEEMKADFTLASHPDNGTEITVTLSGKLAYLTALSTGKRLSFQWLRWSAKRRG